MDQPPLGPATGVVDNTVSTEASGVAGSCLVSELSSAALTLLALSDKTRDFTATAFRQLYTFSSFSALVNGDFFSSARTKIFKSNTGRFF